MADVRLGIVSWNTAALLDECLAALPAALGSLDAEVVVVDNASSDGSAAVAARHPSVTLIENPCNVGYARAMNQALRGTSAPVLIALNPDTRPGPATLATLADRLLVRPDVGLVAPRLVYPDGRHQPSAYRLPSVALTLAAGLAPRRLQRGRLGTRWMLEPAPAPTSPRDVGWAIGAVHVVRAAALAGADPYTQRWFMYVEDLELCWRLARAGWRRRLEADIAVVHTANAAGQAWGASRSARWWPAVYEWYDEAHGPAARRLWAAANATTAAVRSGLAADGLREARMHARAVGALPAVPHDAPPPVA